MAHVEVSRRVGEPAKRVWRAIGVFSDVVMWHPLLVSVKSDGNKVGARRIAVAQDGSRQVERLQAHDPERRFYCYAIEQTSMPVRDYVGELRVDDCGDGTSTVVWSADFEVTDGNQAGTVSAVEQFLQAGVDSLEKEHD